MFTIMPGLHIRIKYSAMRHSTKVYEISTCKNKVLRDRERVRIGVRGQEREGAYLSGEQVKYRTYNGLRYERKVWDQRWRNRPTERRQYKQNIQMRTSREGNKQEEK